MAQEPLSTLGTDLGEVALSPGTGGVFEITYDGTTIGERKADGSFPDPKNSSSGCAIASIPAAILVTSIAAPATRMGPEVRQTIEFNSRY